MGKRPGRPQACLNDAEKETFIFSKGIEMRFPRSTDSILDTIPTNYIGLLTQKRHDLNLNNGNLKYHNYDKTRYIKYGSLLYTPTFTIHSFSSR